MKFGRGNHARREKYPIKAQRAMGSRMMKVMRWRGKARMEGDRCGAEKGSTPVPGIGRKREVSR